MLKHQTVSRQQRRAEFRIERRETPVRLDFPQVPGGFGYIADIEDFGLVLLSCEQFPTIELATAAAIQDVKNHLNGLPGIETTYVRF
jgi:hypothetical protein